MRDILADIVRQTSGLFDVIKVTGTDAETRIEGMDEGKTLFIKAILNQPQRELEGDFGLTNLGLLSGLLSFPNYKADDAVFRVKRRKARDGRDTVEQFEFRDVNGTGADFRAMDASHIEVAEIRAIPWDVSVTPQKSKVAEFSQLATLYSGVNDHFGAKVENGNLVFMIGEENSSDHRVSMVFEADVTGAVKGDAVFPVKTFLNILKIVGSSPCAISIFGQGVLGVTAETPYATYQYILRAKR